MGSGVGALRHLFQNRTFGLKQLFPLVHLFSYFIKLCFGCLCYVRPGLVCGL